MDFTRSNDVTPEVEKHIEKGRAPYTHEEIRQMRRRLETSLTRTEQEHPNIRPLPPMAEDEAKDTLLALVSAAVERTLSEDESLMAGQLLSVYRMAVEARMLGKRGRYFVISEQDIARIAACEANAPVGPEAEPHP